MKYESIADIKTANRAKGHHWFDNDTLGFFKSRVGESVYGGRFFVSSEKGPNMQRRYTVREASKDGSISTVGEFQQYATLAQARSAAQSYA